MSIISSFTDNEATIKELAIVCLFLFKFYVCIYSSFSVFLHRYEIMCQSWMHSPEDRPSFTDVAARLDKLLDDKSTEVMSNSKSLTCFKIKTSKSFFFSKGITVFFY